MPSRSMQKKEVVSAPLSRIGQRRQIVIPKAGRVHMDRQTIQDPDDVLNSKEATKVRQALEQVEEGTTKSWSQVKYELGL